MATYGQMQADLQLIGMGSLIPSDTGELLNKCQREEVESYEWSFLRTNVVINGTVQDTTGTITTVQGSNVVNGVGTDWYPAQAGWYMWMGPTLTTPVLVQSVVSNTQLILSAPWGAPSVSAQGYALQPLYYDVWPIIEVYNIAQITNLQETSRAALNRIDPSRISTGGAPALRWARANFNSAGHFQVELWPRISSALPYIVEGKMGPIDMIQDSDMPLVPSAVLENKALMTLCLAAYASSGNQRYSDLASQYRTDYQRELENAKYADSKRAITLGITAQGTVRRFDALVDENHDFWGTDGY